MHALNVFFLASVLFLGSSCMLIPFEAPQDLKLEKLELTTAQEFDKNFNFAVIKVYFSTKQGLIDFSQEVQYPSDDVLFCEDLKEYLKNEASNNATHMVFPELGASYYLYLGNEPLEWGIKDVMHKKYTQKQINNMSYVTYINIEESFSKDLAEHYNLKTNPKDVCFFVRGSNYIYNRKSNVVNIPKEAIASALKDYKPNQQK
jgi:hypothetical protein